MAVVDAAIGIKTAVNFHSKKNKLGTYSPPLGVLYDTTFLKTLDERHISNGAAEIMKMACVKDWELFELMEEHAEELVHTRFQLRGRELVHTRFQVRAAGVGMVFLFEAVVESGWV